MTSEFVEVVGYQHTDVWQTRKFGAYGPCEEVVEHPRGATGPCVLVIGHDGAHEALFLGRYRQAVK